MIRIGGGGISEDRPNDSSRAELVAKAKKEALESALQAAAPGGASGASGAPAL